MKENCANCKYGLEDKKTTDAYLSCHRYPKPEQVIVTSFCGEFKPKAKEKDKK